MENFSNPIMEKWAERMRELSEAMENNDIARADALKTECDALYQKYKEYADTLYSCNSFQMCNEAIQQALPTLIKNNTKALHEIMKLMKEDKNLSAQFAFVNTMNNCSTNNVLEYVTETLDIVKSQIDMNTVKESNEKLISLVRKYGIGLKEKLDEDKKKMLDSCDYVLTNKKRISNINEYADKLNGICNYVQKHLSTNEERKEDIYSMMESFNSKYSEVLTEDEKSFVREIMDAKSSAVADKQQKFFESMKTECLKGVDALLENCDEAERNELIAIKEEIRTKEYCEETLVKDIAKLLELRDILLDR